MVAIFISSELLVKFHRLFKNTANVSWNFLQSRIYHQPSFPLMQLWSPRQILKATALLSIIGKTRESPQGVGPEQDLQGFHQLVLSAGTR